MRYIFYSIFLLLLVSCAEKKSAYQLLQLETEQSSAVIQEAFSACKNRNVRLGTDPKANMFFDKLDSLSVEILKRTVVNEPCEKWNADVLLMESHMKKQIPHHAEMDSLFLLLKNGCEMSYLKKRQELLYCCFSAMRLDNEQTLFGGFLNRRSLKAEISNAFEENGMLNAKLAVNGFCSPIFRCINADTVFVNKELRISPLKFYPDNNIYTLSIDHLKRGKYDFKGTVFLNTGMNYEELPFNFSYEKKSD